MANVVVNDVNLSAIASAIREKNGTDDTYKVVEMAEAIAAISTGMKLDGYELMYKSVACHSSGVQLVPFAFNNVTAAYDVIIVCLDINYKLGSGSFARYNYFPATAGSKNTWKYSASGNSTVYDFNGSLYFDASGNLRGKQDGGSMQFGGTQKVFYWAKPKEVN